MSIKIYNGFKTTLTPVRLIKLVREFRVKVWRPDAEAQLDRYLENAGKDAWSSWFDRRTAVKRTQESDPVVDTDFRIVVFPIRDIYSEDDVLLGTILTEQRAWIKKWLAQPQIQEYGYWNNTDEPEHVDEGDWETRKREWEKALTGEGRTGIPSMEGFTIDIHDPFGPAPKAWRA